MTVKRIIVTAGEPAGIGPDLVLALSKESWTHQIVVCADKHVLAERAKMLGIKLELIDYQRDAPITPQKAGSLVVEHIPVAHPVVAGQLDESNGHYVLNT